VWLQAALWDSTGNYKSVNNNYSGSARGAVCVCCGRDERDRRKRRITHTGGEAFSLTAWRTSSTLWNMHTRTKLRNWFVFTRVWSQSASSSRVFASRNPCKGLAALLRLHHSKKYVFAFRVACNCTGVKPKTAVFGCIEHHNNFYKSNMWFSTLENSNRTDGAQIYPNCHLWTSPEFSLLKAL